MTIADRWLLPDGVDEILPPQANQLESLRREILDLYQSWGYELVFTPLIEFLDSLLIVPDHELSLQTFKIVDQLTGRTLGVRADITSQVARIDAHCLQVNAPTRLCYADSILHTKPNGMLGSRSPISIGAELYGHSGPDSDIEVISLMLETLQAAGIEELQLALGHVGIYRALIQKAGLDPELEKKLFANLQQKSSEAISRLLESAKADDELLALLKKLSALSGSVSVLTQAREIFSAFPEILTYLDELEIITEAINTRFPGQSLYFDLSELSGYQYHTGIVFAAYTPGFGAAVANGGRYDDIGKVFGRSRAATGFDADLKTLLSLGRKSFEETERIFAPRESDPSLNELVSQLRAQGKQVIYALSGQQESAADMNCSHQIIHQNGSWQLQRVK